VVPAERWNPFIHRTLSRPLSCIQEYRYDSCDAGIS